MLDADGSAAAEEELGAVVAEPPQAVRLSRAAAATPATVKVVRLNDCISILLGCADHCPRGRGFTPHLALFRLWAPTLGWCLTGYSAGAGRWMGEPGKTFFAACGCLCGCVGHRPVKRRNPGPCGPGFLDVNLLDWCSSFVRKGGLEPPRPKAQEPKSCVSANFTTRARLRLTPSVQQKTYDGDCQPPLYRQRAGLSVSRTAGSVSGQPSVATFRSRRSLATWPVARTLYWASATLPSGSTTMVERMRPS
jgi:hypothetical protein